MLRTLRLCPTPRARYFAKQSVPTIQPPAFVLRHVNLNLRTASRGRSLTSVSAASSSRFVNPPRFYSTMANAIQLGNAIATSAAVAADEDAGKGRYNETTLVRGPVAKYNSLVAAGMVREDEHQRNIVKALQQLYKALEDYHPAEVASAGSEQSPFSVCTAKILSSIEPQRPDLCHILTNSQSLFAVIQNFRWRLKAQR
ncbi:hypothetical protein BC936DRAFT_145846 [Jimgerdemannia flammicorona]|uniref:Uncharacterized protein n=2 Tax=Jimgerdemannia flammicorona TaxID=994334 RepID=A0A433D8Y4_9FUNG|nr:hypothetical protein BC936DRAFT_145846 [Jimgerdemannia flammicorona]RUS29023.1 hypothetical protein BC938DRAFT_481154 [Jimgerdemannia flammicorona]